MSKPSPKPFQPVLPTQAERPTSRWRAPISGTNIIRDQLSISTWLLLGALAQGPLFYLLGRLALLPSILILGYRALDAYAQATGWKRNTYLDDIILQKTGGQFPDSEGSYGTEPSRDGVVVIMLGTRCNHPLGMLAPGFKESGDYFASMAADLDAHSEEFGYLGMSAYINVNDRATANEIISIAYFRNSAGLQAFAHSEYHRGAWNWWNKNVKKHPHLSISHEIFDAPRGNWESIYINSHLSGLHATTSKVVNEEGQERWARPVVDASRGVLKTSKGRMARSEALEHERYEFHDVYERSGEKA